MFIWSTVRGPIMQLNPFIRSYKMRIILARKKETPRFFTVLPCNKHKPIIAQIQPQIVFFAERYAFYTQTDQIIYLFVEQIAVRISIIQFFAVDPIFPNYLQWTLRMNRKRCYLMGVALMINCLTKVSSLGYSKRLNARYSSQNKLSLFTMSFIRCSYVAIFIIIAEIFRKHKTGRCRPV